MDALERLNLINKRSFYIENQHLFSYLGLIIMKGASRVKREV